MNIDKPSSPLIRYLLIIWLLATVIFTLNFLNVIHFFGSITPAGGFFFIVINVVFLCIISAMRSFAKTHEAAIHQEKDIALWQYNQIKALTTLIDTTGRAMTTVLNRDKLMRLILESFIKIFQCPTGSLLIYHENENIFKFDVNYGINKTDLKDHVLKSNYPVVFDIVNNYKIISQYSFQSLEEKNIQFLKTDHLDKLGKNIDTLIAITLRIGDKIFGLVFLYVPKAATLIISEYKTMIQITINQATIAIGSAIQSQFAIQDRLTLLYNHDYFVQRLKEEFFRCKRYSLKLCLIMLDIDHFKSFNDNYGHLAGNYVLREVSRIFRNNTRITDTVARYGGEEFSVLMTETGISDAVTIGEKIRKRIQNYLFEYEGQKLNVTISLGINEWEGSEEKDIDYLNLIDQADKKLYEAKRTGRNKVCY